ncbi:hypothetical protein B0H15DRAFT_849935 [Mycena belliarum]|uniref:Zn(2)-C6 fungal-type domain-containing protein n=1 Tax=Mycena belliarum TaxID=1033014 RepID=A0AAD6XK30_9AGAR|nr:hypothetical protein B0H15DRAFT_849935 [Mycena belliae]
MKRAAVAADGTAPKRTKASQACTSCRRQKSRCEILDVRTHGAPTIRCHRCKTLGVECSFETSDLIHFLPKASPHTPGSSSADSPASPDQVNRPPPEVYGGLNTLATVASSRPNAEAAPILPLPSRYGMLPEDLLPTASTPIWGCTSRVDWTATPMLAILDLVRCPRTGPALEIAHVECLADVLSPPEITSLLEIFETRYSPWICAQPGSLQCTNSLLDIVRCTIASRHLEPEVRSAIAPQLQKLSEDVFLREVFNPQPSPDSIRALLILSAWTPICGTGAEARDGRLLIASAVSMARNLHLQNESKRALGLQADLGRLGPEQQRELDESTRRWRLWMQLALCESMLCMGTGREPVSRLSQLDLDMASLPTPANFSLAVIRDIRLGLRAKMYHMTESTLKSRLASVEDMKAFFRDINTSIHSMHVLGRLLNPLPVVTQQDTFYSQMLILEYHTCQLLMIHHALRETRTVHEREMPHIPWHAVTLGEDQVHLSLFWGITGLISAEAVLTAFLAPSDVSLLSTAPDNLYVMVGFAATWIFVSNFHIHQFKGKKVGGASERLQAMTIDRLSQIALAPDHAAGRCGQVLAALLVAWERRKEKDPDSTAPPGRRWVYDMPYESPSTAAPNRDPRQGDNNTDFMAAPGFQGLASGNPENADLFLDDDFWSSFLEQLGNADKQTDILLQDMLQ